MEEDNKVERFSVEMEVGGGNLEVGKRVGDEGERVIDMYGQYNLLKVVEFMKENGSMVEMGLSVMNKNNGVWKK